MEWWNDLWLNEGFAKFMEFVSVTVTHPELKVVCCCSEFYILYPSSPPAPCLYDAAHPPTPTLPPLSSPSVGASTGPSASSPIDVR